MSRDLAIDRRRVIGETLRGHVREWRQISTSAWTAAAVTLGIVLRLVHYFRNPDVWHDEAALLVNVVERSYASLLGPLTYHEAAPPLFLWLQHWIALNIGDSTWTMRLVPLIASCAALVVLVPMARVACPRMVPVAVLLMACSTRLIAHSVEAKPYALDVLVATAAGAAFVLTRDWVPWKRFLLFTFAAPLLIWTSYPAVFVVAGVTLGIAMSSFRRWSVYDVSAATVLLIVSTASVAGLLNGPIAAQRTPVILANWQWAFPAALDPVSLVTWLVRALIGIADYDFRPLGGLLLIPIGLGVRSLVKRREHALLAVFIGPIAFGAVAGLVGQYPFNGTRLMIYSLPALAVLATEGLGQMIEAFQQRSPLLCATAMAASIAPPVVLCARDLVVPWPRPQTAAAARVVESSRQPGDLVASGNWESRYYFRELGGRFVSTDERALPLDAPRVWWVVHGPSIAARHARIQALAGTPYRMVSAVELRGISVFELRP